LFPAADPVPSLAAEVGFETGAAQGHTADKPPKIQLVEA